MPFTEVYGVEQFREVVSESRLTVACFTAVWCGPCKAIEKDLDKMSFEFPNVCFARVDADNNSEIVTKCKVTQLPTFMLVYGGELKDYVIGADMARLKSKVRALANR